MTTFRPDTSFPYLKIAREHGVPYGEVIRYADWIGATAGTQRLLPLHPLHDWQRAVCLSWLQEQNRRRFAA